ncbi:MAG: magnesium transporter [Dehalococcoidia bacterium]|nr:magnesium transporter [Dehalococcoidia bacterium]
MPFVSQIRNRPVRDADGSRVGTLRDLIVRTDLPYPPIESVIVRAGDRLCVVPWSDVASVTPGGTALRRRFQPTRYHVADEDGDAVWLGRDVLDRQIVDTEGVKLVRVNDIALTPLNDELRVAGVDGSTAGLLRRIGLGGRFARRVPLIDWEQVDIGPALRDVQLRVPYQRVRRMHPADIASVVERMSPGEAADVFEALDDETAARAMAELPDERQAAVLSAMEPEEAADVLEEMEPDEAADVLGDMNEDRAGELMRLMEPTAADEVRNLMAYPENTAGGLMDTGVVAVPLQATVGEAIQAVRAASREGDPVSQLYVVDGNECLAGTISLASLIAAPDDVEAGMVAQREVHSVRTNDPDEEVARMLVHYGLLSVPVVDEDGHLVGEVAISDVIDLFAPRAWRTRPRLTRV